MKKVTAKFYCSNAKDEDVPTSCYVGNNSEGKPLYADVTGQNVQLYPVTANGPGQQPEDALFAASTPSGQFWMRIMNEAIRQAGFFQPGKNYRITIEPAD